jgi:hypothetical protein
LPTRYRTWEINFTKKILQHLSVKMKNSF